MAPGADAKEKSVVKSLIESYLEVLKGDGGHNILGYALTIKPGVDPEASYPPTKTRLQTMDYRPLPDDGLSPANQKGRNAFLITEMTGSDDFPRDDLVWQGNWFYGSIQGTLAMNKAIFWDKYILPRVQLINRQTLSMMNEAYYWIAEPNRASDFNWILDKQGLPSETSDALRWKSETPGESFHWENRYDINTGFGRIRCVWVNSNLTNKVIWHPGSGCITITTVMTVGQSDNDVHFDVFRLGTLLTPSYTGERPWSTSDKNSVLQAMWITTITLKAVEKGALDVDVATSTPIVNTVINESSNDTWDKIKKVFGNDLQKFNEALAEKIKTSAAEKITNKNLAKTLRDGLAETNQFIFPGGGTFKMKDPTFNNAGDLLVGLTYVNDKKGNKGIQGEKIDIAKMQQNAQKKAA